MGRGDVTPDAIAHAIDTLDALHNAITLELLDWIVDYDTRQAWKEDGACSMVDWLCFRRSYAHRTSSELVRVAHALKALPAIRASFADGRLSWDKVLVLTQVADTDSDAAWAGEAEQLSVAQLERWVRSYQRTSREEAERKLRERYLRLRWDEDEATLRINGRLVGADAAWVKQAIERIADDQPKLEDGTYAPHEWRCADALIELSSSHLGDLDRATVVVHIDHRELNRINGTAAQEDGPSVVAETVRRLACDGKIQLCVDDDSGRPLKLWRTKRTVPPWLGRQIRKRDTGCRFAHCGRTRGLQIHHIHHWAHDGPTDDDNLLTLCWHHHRLVHEGGWRIPRTPSTTSGSSVPTAHHSAIDRRPWTRTCDDGCSAPPANRRGDARVSSLKPCPLRSSSSFPVLRPPGRRRWRAPSPRGSGCRSSPRTTSKSRCPTHSTRRACGGRSDSAPRRGTSSSCSSSDSSLPRLRRSSSRTSTPTFSGRGCSRSARVIPSSLSRSTASPTRPRSLVATTSVTGTRPITHARGSPRRSPRDGPPTTVRSG